MSLDPNRAETSVETDEEHGGHSEAAHIPPRSVGILRAQAESSYIARVIRLPVQRYIHTESISGLVLIATTIVALVWANSPWYEHYRAFLKTHLMIDLALFSIDMSIQHWINDGLMAIFFFVVGLEIKREALFGQFSTLRGAALPAVAAVGGMVVPAALFLAFNLGEEGMRGWGIPMATDIAFALGVLALLGRRVPMALRVFLLGLAVADDLGAIIVIAVAYTESISFVHLGIVAGLVVLTVIVNRIGFNHAAITAAIGFCIWVAMLKSGVHATIAGVIFGLLMSARPHIGPREFAERSASLIRDYRQAIADGNSESSKVMLGELEELSQGTESPLERLERLAHPWASYVILPIFAFANAGLHLTGVDLGSVFTSDVTLGVVLGLLVGKVVGITLFPWLASKFGIVELPRYVTWTHVIGTGFLGGIGFTMAIFITGLAFTDPTLVLSATAGIMCASAAAGLLGYTLLRVTSHRW